MRPEYNELVEMLASNPEVYADEVFDYYDMNNNERYTIVHVYGEGIARTLEQVWERSSNDSYTKVNDGN